MALTDILKDEEFLPVAKSLIASAKESIFIASFKLEISKKSKSQRVAQLFDFLTKKKQIGVDVRVLINPVINKRYIPPTNTVAICELKKQKIPVRCLPNNRICHAKIIIIDKEIAICGSHNLSVKSCHYNFEVSCLLTEQQPVLRLAAVYEGLWNTARNV